jgi:glycyl-tRNA synthetase beta subunit
MVMSDDQQLKNNRLALLLQIRKEFIKIADIAML